ncbi:MAG: tRNA lysidine(34) synthetase TilS [Henriciella sp.]
MQFGADFQTLIERFSPHRNKPIALAVSGGSDSMALLHLAHEWAGRDQRTLLVLTVDHRLRPEAKQEAERVATLSAQLGHHHETQVWEEPRESQAAARRARYALLARAARTHDAACLLTGHTFDDVVETALIRRRRGVRDASIAGPVLAAPVPIWPEGRFVTLLRPLIRTSRSELRSYLRASGQVWVEDPSNEKTVFERVRVRAFLARHPHLAEIAGAYVQSLQRARTEQQGAMAEALGEVNIDTSGLIDTASAAVSPDLLKRLIRCASGSSDDARDGAVRQLLASLTSPGQRQTLGGAWIQRTKTGFLIGRDPASSAQSGEEDLFDGRYQRDTTANLPEAADLPFLVRQSAPPGSQWREIISDRLAHLMRCYQTPLLNPVQR